MFILFRILLLLLLLLLWFLLLLLLFFRFFSCLFLFFFNSRHLFLLLYIFFLFFFLFFLTLLSILFLLFVTLLLLIEFNLRYFLIHEFQASTPDLSTPQHNHPNSPIQILPTCAFPYPLQDIPHLFLHFITLFIQSW